MAESAQTGWPAAASRVAALVGAFVEVVVAKFATVAEMTSYRANHCCRCAGAPPAVAVAAAAAAAVAAAVERQRRVASAPRTPADARARAARLAAQCAASISAARRSAA